MSQHLLHVMERPAGLQQPTAGLVPQVVEVQVGDPGVRAGRQPRFTRRQASQYLDPFNNLLFFAAWPMLAACFAFYLLRELDTRLAVDR